MTLGYCCHDTRVLLTGVAHHSSFYKQSFDSCYQCDHPLWPITGFGLQCDRITQHKISYLTHSHTHNILTIETDSVENRTQKHRLVTGWST